MYRQFFFLLEVHIIRQHGKQTDKRSNHHAASNILNIYVMIQIGGTKQTQNVYIFRHFCFLSNNIK